MPEIPKIIINMLLAMVFLIIGNLLVTYLGVSSRWLIILAVVIYYIVWWNLRRPSK